MLKRETWGFFSGCTTGRWYYSIPRGRCARIPAVVAGTQVELRSLWHSTPPEEFNDIIGRYEYRRDGRRYEAVAGADHTLGDLGEMFVFYWLKQHLEPPALREFANRNQLLALRAAEDLNPIDISFEYRMAGVWYFVHVCVKTSWEDSDRQSSAPFSGLTAAALLMPRPTLILQFQLKNCECGIEFVRPNFFYKLRVLRNFYNTETLRSRVSARFRDNIGLVVLVRVRDEGF